MIAFVAVLDSQFPQRPLFEDKHIKAKLPNAVSVTAWNNLFRCVGVETRESGKG